MGVSKRVHDLTSSTLAFAKAIPTMTFLEESVRSDLLQICRNYGSLGVDPFELAKSHADLVRDVEFSASQIENLFDRQELAIKQYWAQAWTNARQDLIDESKTDGRSTGIKPTEEQVKNRALLNPLFRAMEEKLLDLKRVKSFLDGLRKGLYSRSLMVNILCKDNGNNDRWDEDL